jgi:hypothetical protein
MVLSFGGHFSLSDKFVEMALPLWQKELKVCRIMENLARRFNI